MLGSSGGGNPAPNLSHETKTKKNGTRVGLSLLAVTIAGDDQLEVLTPWEGL